MAPYLLSLSSRPVWTACGGPGGLLGRSDLCSAAITEMGEGYWVLFKSNRNTQLPSRMVTTMTTILCEVTVPGTEWPC